MKTKKPNFKEEKKLWRKGYRFVVGLDEAGRGPLAGPVIAAAAAIKIFNFQFSILNKFSIFNFQKLKALENIKDSKKLSPKKREELYKILTNCDFVEWGIGRVSEKVIDKINILEATKLAMQKAVKSLERRIEKKIKKRSCPKSRDREILAQLDFLIVDGNFGINSKIPQKSIIKADEKVFSCAAASIIAKVTRDRIMFKYHIKYQHYGFDKHKGYPTKKHRRALKKFGICPIHRKSFRPVKELFTY